MNRRSGWRVSTELLLEMGRITRGNLTRDEALSRIARLLVESFELDLCAIMIYDPSLKSCYVGPSHSRVPETGFLTEDMTLRLKPDSKLWQAITSPNAPIILRGGLSDSVLGQLSFAWMAIVPMNSGDEVTGVMVLVKTQGKEPGKVNPDILMAICSQAAMIAMKASLLENLRLTEDRYKMLMENAGDFVFVLDGGGRFLYANSRVRDILGYEPEEMIGKYFGEFVSPESWAKTVSLVKQAVSNKDTRIDYVWHFRDKAGDTVTLEVRASLLYHGFELSRHQGIGRDVLRETRLEKELERKNQELDKFKGREEVMKEYLTVANMAQEEERRRIARDLHDGPIQYLVALRRRLDLLRKELSNKSRPYSDSGKLLSEIDGFVDQVTLDLRQFARTLRPPVLDDFGLVSACEWLCDQARKEGKAVNFKVLGTPKTLSEEIETSVFRIAQEATSNAIKHSDATLIELILAFDDESLALTVKDNGKGFDLPSSPSSLARAGQMGLIGMYERSEILGAVISLKSEKGKGTTLSLKIPRINELRQNA